MGIQIKLLAILISTMLAGAPISAASAQTTGISLGPSAGTDGIGADALYKLNPFLAARGGVRYAGFGLDRTIDDIRYDIDVGFTSGVVALDIHPMTNGFRISGGAYFGAREIGLDATPANPVEIGDLVFSPAEIGVINGTADWNNAAPFIGVGFNNGLNAIKRFGFQAMLGAMYIGEPEVTLEATGGLLANDPTFLAELAEEEQNLADDLDDVRFYPVLSLGFTVRF